jgi:transcription elongation factor GreA
MAESKVYMTQKGYDRLRAELSTLKTEDRPNIITAIAEARAHGDLSENAEYQAAREKQRLIEARISELELKIADAEIIEIKAPKDNSVVFGAHVKLLDESTEAEFCYQILGEDEADVKNGRISVSSPLARGLLGKREGDSVEITTPSGVRNYEILNISYMH